MGWTSLRVRVKELFGGGGGAEAAMPDGIGNRKLSNGSTGSNTKHKWLKAFKSLKTTPTTPPNEKKQAMYHAVSSVVAMSRKNLESESGGHQWREYTYRKITPCDACGQALRGHSRQGFRCRNCKANAHADCMSSVQPANCPAASKRGAGIPLLRRQKSTAPPVEEPPTTEQRRRGSGSSASGTRPFGQPLVLTTPTSGASSAPPIVNRPPQQFDSKRNLGRKR